MNDMARIAGPNGMAGQQARPAPQSSSAAQARPAPQAHAAPQGHGTQPASRRMPEMVNGTVPIGEVMEISGSGSRVAIDLNALLAYSGEEDPSLVQAGQVGSLIKIQVGNRWLVANIRTQMLDPHLHNAEGGAGLSAEVDFLGEGQQERLTGRIYGFRRGVTRYPVPGTPIFPATTAELRQIYASDGGATIKIGTVFPSNDIRASLQVDHMLGKHFALLGSTGTGKSTAAALILHRICELAPEGHILMIDPHGEYPEAFRDVGQLLDVSNLQMPYWLMNFEEHCEVFVAMKGSERQIDCDILAKCLLQARMKNRLAEQLGRITVDSPIPYLLSDLLNILTNEMGKLDKASNSLPYLRVKTKIEELRADPRYQFMFSGMLVGDTMVDFISKIFRMPAQGKPISIIDVSGVPSEITSTVVAVLSRLAFDYAIWARGGDVRPVLLVCEEAHRYIPSERNADGSSVGRILSRIAKEGRKYGISLGLITQRPSDLAEGVLSQCGTIISMRLNNERDQAFVKAAMPEGSRGFLDSIQALRNRECIICGEGVPIPIRATFDDLDANKRPASSDPSFTMLWNQRGGEENAVARTVMRWRSQVR